MFTLKNLKLRGRILFGYTVPLLLTTAATSVVVMNAQTVGHQELAINKGWELVQSTDRLELLLYKRQSLIRSYLLTTNTQFLQEYEATVKTYAKLIETLEELVQLSKPEQAKRLEQLKQLGKEIFTANMQMVDLVRAGKPQAAVQQFRQGKVLALVDQAVNIFQELNSTEDNLQKLRQQAGTAAMQSLVVLAIAGTLTAVVLAIGLGVWIASRISHEMNAVVSTIATSSTEIATTVEQQERIAIQQSSSVNETTTTMDQLSTSALQTAQQAETATQGSQKVLALSEEGNQAVHQTLENMSLLADRVNAVASQIVHLSEQTGQIGNISGLVANLANQTNMLALNAAIEAVRAGEHGKGFAVVAGEIRKLADESRISAEKINGLVMDIQTAISSTVIATNESRKATEQGTQVTQRTATVFNQVTESINDVTRRVQQISLNTQQQELAVRQVLNSMNILNTGAKDTASGISQTRVSTHQLSR